MSRLTLADRLMGWRERPFVTALVVMLALAAGAASVKASPGVPGFLGAGLALLTITIAVIDARYFIIPNELTLAVVALGLANAAFTSPLAMGEGVALAVLRGAVLALLFWLLRAAYRRFRGREGIGLGDVKLAGAAGVWLSVPAAPIAIEVAALATIAAFAVWHVAMKRPLDAGLKFPFGVFLGPSIWIGWMLDVTLLAPF